MAIKSPPHPLRLWRENQGKSQGHCAGLVGVTRQTWNAWERGKQVPQASMMAQIATLTGGQVTANDFYPQIGEAA